MTRANLSQTSFTGGELSPRVLGHTDVDRYATGLLRCRNAHPVIHGGVKRRAGTRYLAAAQSTRALTSFLIPFVQGRAAAFMIEFGDAVLRIYDAAGAYTGVELPHAFGPGASVDFAQSDSTMYLFDLAGVVRPYRVQRFKNGVWTISQVPFTQMPFAEAGKLVSATGTLTQLTVGPGRTLSASAPTFLASFVGRGVLYQGGVAVITAVGSPTSAVVTITREFFSASFIDWVIEGSPQATITPSATGPVGALIGLNLDIDGWSSSDVGSIVRVNGGLARISSVASATAASAVVLRELAGITPAPALAWSLEPEVWGGAWGYPRTGTVYQQRLVVAGSPKFPRTVWGSRPGEQTDFELGTADDNAFAHTIDSDESSPIVYISAGKSLAVFTESGEYSMKGGIEKPITPTNVRVAQESNHGCAAVRPVTINREVMFVQGAGRKLRAYGYRYDFDGFSAVDITALAEHLTESGLRSLAYQQTPEQLLWAVRNDGKLLSCTIDRDQQPAVIAWALHETDGLVEAVASIPNGDSDDLWMIVGRRINNVFRRYIERLDHSFRPMAAAT